MTNNAHPPLPRCKPRGREAFTLVELLVVIGVIAILIGLLLPVLGRAKQQANLVACKSNLSQIANATRMYANDNQDRYPDSYTLGGAFFRRGYLEVNPADPYSAPEIFGMPALYEQLGLLKNARKVWICPSQSPEIQAYRNTYVWALQPNPWTSAKRKNPSNVETFWVNDNFANLPFRTGARRGTGDPNPVLNSKYWVFPHRYRGKLVSAANELSGNARRGAINVLFMDGHVGMALYVDPLPGATGNPPPPRTVIIRGE